MQFVTPLPIVLFCAQKRKARCHWPPFSQALTTELQVITVGCKRLPSSAWYKHMACCHCPSFAHALNGFENHVPVMCIVTTIYFQKEQCQRKPFCSARSGYTDDGIVGDDVGHLQRWRVSPDISELWKRVDHSAPWSTLVPFVASCSVRSDARSP